MTTHPRRRRLVGLLCGLLLVGCTPVTPTASPSPTPTTLDFTRPGAASAMVSRLLTKANTEYALMVEVATNSVEVSVLDADRKPVTWAYRDGEIGEVASDLQYVDQATFPVAKFNISDVGALFRAAQGQSGSAESQRLTIVDYSGGEVMMSVSTVPESRTVFFNPDGSLLQVLDFDTPGGVATGIRDAVGDRATVYSISVESDQGAWAEFPGGGGTTVRRTRTAKVPVTTNVTDQQIDLPLFLASRVDPETIWTVVDGIRGSAEVPEGTRWSVVIDDRESLGTPRMHFAIGSTVITTDLDGNIVSS
nr:hypothetical protein [Propionicimonas sp.]